MSPECIHTLQDREPSGRDQETKYLNKRAVTNADTVENFSDVWELA